jgi:hypothetical protein
LSDKFSFNFAAGVAGGRIFIGVVTAGKLAEG